MKESTQFKVFILSQCPDQIAALRKWIQYFGLHALYFSGESECLGNLSEKNPALVIADNDSLPSGTSFIRKVRNQLPLLPVWCMIDHKEISLAVQCMKAGANEIIELPIHDSILKNTLANFCRTTLGPKAFVHKALSQTEKKILLKILEGLTNDQIAESMDRSIRTVEDHRSKIMKKLGAQNSVELVYRARHLDLDSSD